MDDVTKECGLEYMYDLGVAERDALEKAGYIHYMRGDALHVSMKYATNGMTHQEREAYTRGFLSKGTP